MLGSPGPTQADVKEGESLNLRVELDAYPSPSALFWSYNGKRLLNTTEHVITIHRHKYRYSKCVEGNDCKRMCTCPHRPYKCMLFSSDTSLS